MAKRYFRTSVAIGVNKLIVELKNELPWIQSNGTVRMQREMREGLISKKRRGRALKFFEALHGNAPIELPVKQSDAGVDRTSLFSVIEQ